MIVPAYQSLLHLMIQIDLLTEVQWNHSKCAQVSTTLKCAEFQCKLTWVLVANDVL